MAIPKVKDVMVRDVLKTDKNSTVLDIARMLDRHKLGAVIITDKNDFPEGIVSERDIIRAITAYGEKAVSVCACNIMSSPVLSLGPDADIESAASLMTENRIRRIPIVDDNRLIGLISYRDITNALRKSYFMLQEKTEILEEKANKDSLTGLYNKGYIVEQLKYHISLAERTRNPMAVIMLDIDYFKKINDTHGHLCGDRILKSIADILKEKSRAINIVGRYGGEEFIIIGPISDHKSAYYLAERLRESVEASLFKCEKNRFKVTISAGVAIWNSSIKDWKQLVKHADTALYAAKNAGRNRVVMEGD